MDFRSILHRNRFLLGSGSDCRFLLDLFSRVFHLPTRLFCRSFFFCHPSIHQRLDVDIAINEFLQMSSRKIEFAVEIVRCKAVSIQGAHQGIGVAYIHRLAIHCARNGPVARYCKVKLKVNFFATTIRDNKFGFKTGFLTTRRIAHGMLGITVFILENQQEPVSTIAR